MLSPRRLFLRFFVVAKLIAIGGRAVRPPRILRTTPSYHFDLGYEYWFDSGDGSGGIYFYDFASRSFFYTSPTYAFPYLYDFSLNAFLYYFPDPNNPGRCNPKGCVRYCINLNTGETII